MILNASVKNLAWLKQGLLIGLLSSPVSLMAAEWSGFIAGEYRYFQHQSPFSQPEQHNASIVLSPEFYHEWLDGRQSILIAPFLRVDSDDDERTHADFREFNWLYVAKDWELRLGLGKVFWGVTESQHLVDVINQTDLVENSDGEDKLGQPMINLSLYRDWGAVDLFVLPYFRERTFAGEKGRLRSGLVVDTDKATYESGAGRRHIDLSIRWSHTLGDWDLGLSHFYGTNREPVLQVSPTLDSLIPFYEIMHQTGLDLQYTSESWLWKLELIRRETDSETLSALTGGFEYTFYGVAETDIDVGVLTEYLFDDRNDPATAPLENDLMLGTRITWNDENSTELLFGLIQDLDSDDRSWNIEASRRIGDRWKLSLEARLFSIKQVNSAFYPIRDDDYFQIDLARYF